MSSKTEKDLWIEMSIREIWTQTHFAEISFNNINVKSANNTDLVFSSIHSFLSHCANTSKMLKASDEKRGIISHVLRIFHKSKKTIIIGDVLNIPKSSIIHNRKFRNHLEHYDERLKKWIKDKGPNINIGTYNIGPKSAIKATHFIFVTHYDPTNHKFTFVDKDIKLDDLYLEVKKINNIADTWVNKMQTGAIRPPFA